MTTPMPATRDRCAGCGLHRADIEGPIPGHLDRCLGADADLYVTEAEWRVIDTCYCGMGSIYTPHAPFCAASRYRQATRRREPR